MKRIIALLLTLTALLILSSCATRPLLGEVTLSASELRPTGAGETVTVTYAIGRPARVTVALVDEQGTRYTLRRDEPRAPSSDPYALRFDGTAPTDDPTLLRRLLPAGTYTVVVEAVGEDGARQIAERRLTIIGQDAPLPLIENLVIYPDTISPNADAIDDVAEITYQLPTTATVDIVVTAPDGATFPFVTAAEEEPALQKHVWNGRTVDGTLLPDGVYTLIIRAQDRFGNLVERRSPITIAGGDQPEALITYSYMAPQSVMLGEVITVTVRVRNTGKVPIRTYGPPSGYEYDTDQVFSSIENGAYVARSGGFWRVGVDWDANSGGAAKRYPYRWAISPRPPDQWRIPFEEDLLMPGEEAEIVGRIRILQPETKMGFYVGLIQDGVGFFQDRTGRTIINVGF